MHAEDIDTELAKQNKLFKKANTEMDKTQMQLDAVSAKLGALLKTSDASTIYTIMILTGILLGLILLVIFTWNSNDSSLIIEKQALTLKFSDQLSACFSN